MEKFSAWRDGATGIAPFLPISSNSPRNKTVVLILSPVSFILSGVRLIVVSIFTFLYLLIDLIPGINGLAVYIARLIRLVSGVLVSDVRYEGPKKTVFKPIAGDVIISNFVSPLDPLVFASLYKPIFVVPTSKGINTEGLISAQSSALHPPQLSNTGSQKIEKLITKAKASGRIVVIFAEGTTSNGKALLPLQSIPFSELGADSSTRLFPVQLKYDPSTVVTPIPSSFLLWQMWLLGSFSTYKVRVRYAEPIKSFSQLSNDNTMKNISEAISRVGRFPKLGDQLNINAKRDFLDAWKKGRR